MLFRPVDEENIIMRKDMLLTLTCLTVCVEHEYESTPLTYCYVQNEQGDLFYMALEEGGKYDEPLLAFMIPRSDWRRDDHVTN